MAVFHLDRMTWADIETLIKSGRGTVVVPLGSTEQHGRHLPLGTDSLIGDELGIGLADRLNAFITPTLRFGCSNHHLAFAGTISLTENTFQNVVIDVTKSLCRHGFIKIVLLPTHGGNFAPLKKALSQLGDIHGVRILAFTDLDALVEITQKSSAISGVEPSRCGAHAGEWETSVVLSLRPEQVNMGAAVEGFLGDISEISDKIMSGIEKLNVNGVLGDPRKGNAEAGKRYINETIDFLYQWVVREETEEPIPAREV